MSTLDKFAEILARPEVKACADLAVVVRDRKLESEMDKKEKKLLMDPICLRGSTVKGRSAVPDDVSCESHVTNRMFGVRTSKFSCLHCQVSLKGRMLSARNLIEYCYICDKQKRDGGQHQQDGK
jgi:hypothetical protein